MAKALFWFGVGGVAISLTVSIVLAFTQEPLRKPVAPEQQQTVPVPILPQ